MTTQLKYLRIQDLRYFAGRLNGFDGRKLDVITSKDNLIKDITARLRELGYNGP